jgi:predicted amidohydrolase
MKGKLSRRSFVSLASTGVAATYAQTPAPTRGAVNELRVGACQILTYPEPKRSAEKICHWLEKAAQDSLDVVVFPEAAVCGYTCEKDYWKQADPAAFQAAEEVILTSARKLKLAVVLGTAHWEEGKVFNSLLVADKGGEVRGRYAKTFLAEAWPTPGRHRLPVWTVAGVKSCFIICHDIRYPELVRLPAIAGAQICYYSSNESGLLEEHKLSAYRAMPISRATENTIYLVMANAPADATNMRGDSQSHGNSKIINPDGNVLGEAGFFGETLISATINIDKATRSIANRTVTEQTILRGWLRDGAQLVEREKP